MKTYNRNFYEQQMSGSRKSAEIIAPIVMELLHPKSVIDVGCGVGTWLAVYRELGVETILGVDGDYVKPDMLQIKPQDFAVKDLAKPLDVGRTFDLVQSLEVAEHLDEAHAEDFVDSLTRLGKVVLFSAAIPHQLGENHDNEQFLDYWIRLFQRRGFELVDCIRRRIWENREIEVWYRQNTVMFAEQAHLASHATLRAQRDASRDSLASVVHPELYSSRVVSLTSALAELAQGLHRSGQLDNARAIYKLVLHFHPKYAEVWSLLGSLDAQRGRFDEAVTDLDKAIRLKPGAANFFFQRGQVHAALGRKSEAKVDFETALQLDPSLRQAQDSLKNLF